MQNERSEKKSIFTFLYLLKDAEIPKAMIFIALFLSLLETVAALIVPLFTKSLVDQLALSSLELSVILLLIITFLAQAISSGFSFYFMKRIGEAVVASMRKKLWEHILYLPIPFFDRQQSGEMMSRITQDTNTVKSLITDHLVSLITGIISIIGAVIILFIIDWKMTLIMILAVPISLLIMMPLGKKMYQISLNNQDEMANLSGLLGRALSDIRLVKAFHSEKLEKEKGDKRIDDLFQYGLKEARILAIISPFMTLIIMVVLVILIGYGGIQVASGALTSGALVAIILYMFQIVLPFTQMATFFTAFQKAMGATERINTILAVKVEEKKQTPFVFDDKETIIFHNVSFAYDIEKPILKNVNLRLKAGKTTAFVGPSGSGKTTLFSLLERFYLPNEGAITYGKTEIQLFELGSWRKQIGYVSQESPIMAGTIRENICYGLNDSSSDEAIISAAKQANAHEFIKKLPNGYDTEVGERGIKLSGGQRQRIAIARALIRDPKILLFDEATSNLDSESEQLVQQALTKLAKDRTTFIIAHRLSTVIDADQIIVLENGQVTGTGTHEELLNNHSLYQKLAAQQLYQG